MNKIIPIVSAEYGRYISRFRMIPYEIDCLTPVYRRLLLSMHEIANKKLVKSAKITGYTSGTYHPHGSAAIYGALITLYKQGFLDIQGNFGSPGLEDASASSERYTECRLKKWVDEFCFKFIDLVPWENFEYENEPLFIPSIIPIGLIGDGDIYSGIAYHRCIIPRYKISDLAKRLKYLITEDENDHIIIYPNFEKDGCLCRKNDEQAENILKKGSGTINVIPKFQISNNELIVQGRVPQTNFNSLKEEETASCKCLSADSINIVIKPTKRGEDIKTFSKRILSNHIIKNINFNIFVCDVDGRVQLKGVDQILLDCYSYYVEFSKYNFINLCFEQIEKKYENEIIIEIRKIIQNNHTIKTVDEIVSEFKRLNKSIQKDSFDFEKNKWITNNTHVKEEEVRNICNSKNIKSLVEYNINISDNINKINDLKKKIIDNNNICFQELSDLEKR